MGSYGEFEQTVVPNDPDPKADESVSFTDDDDVFGGGVEPLNANPPELDDSGQIVETPSADPLGGGESVSGSETGSIAETAPAEPASAESVVADTETAASATENGSRADGSNADEPTGFADSGFESASENLDDPVEAQVAALTETVERQNELLERQQRTIERLIEEIGRGR